MPEISNFYHYEDYKLVIQDKLNSGPNSGYGGLSRLAKFLKVHPTFVSQVIKGDKHFSPEQAVHLPNFLGLDADQAHFFVLLLYHARSGNSALRRFWSNQMRAFRERQLEVANQLPENLSRLSEGIEQEYYSAWHYAAARIATSLDAVNTSADVADHLRINQTKTAEIVAFLLRHGLCATDAAGNLRLGPNAVHVGRENPNVAQHHTNWRLRAIEAARERRDDDFFFTGVLSLGQLEAKQIKAQLLDQISKASKSVEQAPCERMACLNIDFFSVP